MKKIKDLYSKQCLHREHAPSTPHCFLPPGTHTHMCPGCGKKYAITIPQRGTNQ